MDSDLKQRLASAAATDPMVRDALKELEWLEARPFEEFPTYWHSRLNDCSAGESWRNTAASHPLLKDVWAYEKQLIKRIFAELEALAWHRGYADSKAWIAKDLGEVMVHARELYLLGEQQHAYFLGLVEARKFLMVKLGIAEAMRELERGAETQAIYTAMLQKLNATIQ